jgi:hypothetical protein
MKFEGISVKRYSSTFTKSYFLDTRREFLKKAALLSGATGFSALPVSIQKALAIDPAPGQYIPRCRTCCFADAGKPFIRSFIWHAAGRARF